MIEELRKRGQGIAIKRTVAWAIVLMFYFLIMIYEDANTPFFQAFVWRVIVLLIALCHILVGWFYALTGGAFRGIKQFCGSSDNPEMILSRIIEAWDNDVNKKFCWMEDEYLVWTRWMNSKVIPLKNIENSQDAKTSYIPRTLAAIGSRIHVYQIYVSYKDGGSDIIDFEEKDDYIKVKRNIAKYLTKAHINAEHNEQFQLVE